MVILKKTKKIRIFLFAMASSCIPQKLSLGELGKRVLPSWSGEHSMMNAKIGTAAL